ncbi:MAG: hypothetical protein AB7G37_12580 [Solirubrobacteraceae bacterium]
MRRATGPHRGLAGGGGGSIAIPAAPALVLLTLIFLGSGGGAEYHGASQLVRATTIVAVVVPVAAALAAWEGARARALAVVPPGAIRPSWPVVRRHVGPVAAVAGLCLVVATALLLVGRSFAPSDLLVLAVPPTVGAAHLLAGFLLGLRVRAVLAVPVALLASWVLLVVPITLEPVWVRHVTGYLPDCCEIDAVVAPSAIGASVLLNGGLVVALLVATSAGARRALRTAAGATVALGALVGAVLLASGLGPDPAVARPTGDLVCRDTAPRTCVWPEHERRRSDLAARARSLARHLDRVGIPVPAVVTEGPPATGRWPVLIDRDASRDVLDGALLYGLTLPPATCGADEPAEVDALRWTVLLWMTHHAGVPEGVLGGSVYDEDRDAVAAILRAPRGTQSTWAARALRDVRRCPTPTGGPS